jgi:hypothetical protein
MLKQHHHHHLPRSSKGALSLLPCADTLGMAASVLCLVHCLALPAILLLAPALSAGLTHDDRTHYCLAMFVTMFCLLGILPGYLQHSQKNVLCMMILGLSMVLFATFASAIMLGERFEIPIITVGNLLVVAAHYRNRKLLTCSH